MGLFNKGRQRMGQGLRSCQNLNNWNHLFNPNSPSALQGEIACDLYWGLVGGPTGGKIGGSIVKTADNGRKMLLRTDATGNTIGGWTYADTGKPVAEKDRLSEPCPYNCPAAEKPTKGVFDAKGNRAASRVLYAPGYDENGKIETVDQEARAATIKFFVVVAIVGVIIYKIK